MNRSLLFVGGALALVAVGCQPAPTLTNVQDMVFTPRCANAACHAGANPPLDLDLSEGNAYANIVNVASVAVNGTTRVVPGDPGASLVFLVTEGDQGAVRKMPVGGDLDDTEAELLRQWIEDGAPAD